MTIIIVTLRRTIMQTLPKPSAWLSQDAIDLAVKLIKSLQIQAGDNLARLLDVSPIFFNHEAVFVWVQRQIDEGLTVGENALNALEAAFLGALHEVGWFDDI